jgi:hypothetical protein
MKAGPEAIFLNAEVLMQQCCAVRREPRAHDRGVRGLDPRQSTIQMAGRGPEVGRPRQDAMAPCLLPCAMVTPILAPLLLPVIIVPRL